MSKGFEQLKKDIVFDKLSNNQSRDARKKQTMLVKINKKLDKLRRQDLGEI